MKSNYGTTYESDQVNVPEGKNDEAKDLTSCDTPNETEKHIEKLFASVVVIDPELHM